MRKKVAVKEEPTVDDTFVGELEFSQPADVLIQAIEQRITRRDGVEPDRATVLAIANQILESRP